MRYKINWMERKVISTGKDKISAELVDESGNLIGDVTIWSDYPEFLNIGPGSELNGDITTKQNGQYVNKTLYAAKTYKTFAKKPDMNGMMEKKAENIATAQGNKELGIKVSSTMRMAVDIVNSQGIEDKTPADIQNLIEYWRKYLWLQWDKEEKDYPPF